MTRNYILEYNTAITLGIVTVGKWIKKIYSIICRKIDSKEYCFDAEKAEKAKIAAEKKAKKIAQDKKMREEKAKAKAEHSAKAKT